MIVRLIGFAAGLVFVIALLVAAVLPREEAAEDTTKLFHRHPVEVKWQHDGVFGTFDRAQLQRGFQVYKEVCAACHGLQRVAFRNLADLGFSEPEVKAIAKAYEVPAVDDKTGEPSTRKALPSDHFPSPYANEVAARAANNNALPPDLSLITKAREEGERYVYSLLTGYTAPPANLPEDKRPGPGLHYNPYFANLNIAMPAPLTSEGQVTYADGTKATVPQMAKDVTAFLTWAAEPKLEDRRRAGVGTIIFLLILTSLAYLSYRKVWAEVKGMGAARNQL